MKTIALVLLAALCLCGNDFELKWRELNAQAKGAKGEKLIAALEALNELVPGNERILRALGRLPLVDVKPVTQAKLLGTIEGEDWIAEDLVFIGKEWLFSSVRRGMILESDGRAFAHAGMGVFALGVDPKHRLLWSTAGWVPQCEICRIEDKGKSALIAYDLKTGDEKHRVESPIGGVLGDMVVSSGGDVYVTNNSGGAVYRMLAGTLKLERLDEAGEFPSPQTPALSADGKTLYVADYRRGIAALDLGTKAVRWLKPGPGVIVSGIDGLYVWRNSFVAVQNGVTPVRIVKFARDLSKQEVLETKWKGFGEPTHGAIVGNEFCFLANTGWDAFEEDGRKKAGKGDVKSAVYCRALLR